MKILFIGNLHSYTRTRQRKQALVDLGHNVLACSSAQINAKETSIPLIDRLLWKIGFTRDLTQNNRAIIIHASQFQPDIFWIEKGVQIWPHTLKKVRQLCTDLQIVSYAEDDMYATHNRSYFYTWGLKYYDVVFTTKSYNSNPDELPALGANRVVFVDKAYCKYVHKPMTLSQQDYKLLGSDVGFIGTFAEDRAQKMLFLAKNGIQIRIWGNRWRYWVGKHPNLRVENRPLYNDDYAKAICATKINLCFLRKENRDLQTDRTMEIPACGAFMLAERTDEHLRLFAENQEAAYFDINNLDELLAKVRYYLRSESERLAIARAGRERCLRSGYSHHDRLKFMINQIKVD